MFTIIFYTAFMVLRLIHILSPGEKDLRPYSKRKLELEFNLSEILPVNCKLWFYYNLI